VEEPEEGTDPLRLVRKKSFDLVLLDLDMLGTEGCRRVREASPRSGIVAVANRHLDGGRARALEAGADECVTEPLEPRELLASLRAVLRRVPGPDAPQTMLHVGDFQMDLERRQLYRSGKAIHLTRKEFNLLAYMMQRAGTALSHERLLRAIWGPEYGNELEYLRAYVWMLRKKIETDPTNPEYLRTETGVGYRFQDPLEAMAPGE